MSLASDHFQNHTCHERILKVDSYEEYQLEDVSISRVSYQAFEFLPYTQRDQRPLWLPLDLFVEGVAFDGDSVDFFDEFDHV